MSVEKGEFTQSHQRFGQLERPAKMASGSGAACSVQVCIRVRPETNENSHKRTISVESSRVVKARDVTDSHDNVHTFTFDHAFDSHANNKEIGHKIVDPLVESVLQGGHCTLASFGETHSGKTYTTNSMIEYTLSQILPRLDRGLTVKVAYLEVYLTEIYDLLLAGHTETTELLPRMRLRKDHNTENFHVKDLVPVPVTSAEQFSTMFKEAFKRRKHAHQGTCTRGRSRKAPNRVTNYFLCVEMNMKQSRSHTILKLYINNQGKEGNKGTTSSTAPTNTAQHTTRIHSSRRYSVVRGFGCE